MRPDPELLTFPFFANISFLTRSAPDSELLFSLIQQRVDSDPFPPIIFIIILFSLTKNTKSNLYSYTLLYFFLNKKTKNIFLKQIYLFLN